MNVTLDGGPIPPTDLLNKILGVTTSQITNEPTKSLFLGLQNYSTQINVYWNQVMAASLVVSLPVVVAFLLLQKYLVTGLTSGSVK
ncbi:MAG: multiple sugar transport system permease protein [Actinomycetota bacterium]|jgi:multiple sugar transport system permease protein|nr:multiple sugar transport system permease protein [Actinomycetota bacterium]